MPDSTVLSHLVEMISDAFLSEAYRSGHFGLGHTGILPQQGDYRGRCFYRRFYQRFNRRFYRRLGASTGVVSRASPVAATCAERTQGECERMQA